MERKHLHLKGPELSRIVTGAWRWNDVSPATADKLIGVSLDNGITSFDHADIYGDYGNEEIFGRALAKNPGLRKNIQLITKCGVKLMSDQWPGTQIKHYDTSKEHIIQSVDASLKKLHTEYVDLLLIHRPDPLMDPEEVSETFGKLMSSAGNLWSKKEKYNATETQLSLAWLLKHPSGLFPIVGTTQPDRIAESAKSVEIKLERRDWFEMLKIATGKDVA